CESSARARKRKVRKHGKLAEAACQLCEHRDGGTPKSQNDDAALHRIETAGDTSAQRETGPGRKEEPAGEESRRLWQEKQKRTKGDPGNSPCDRPEGGASYQDALFYLR